MTKNPAIEWANRLTHPGCGRAESAWLAGWNAFTVIPRRDSLALAQAADGLGWLNETTTATFGRLYPKGPRCPETVAVLRQHLGGLCRNTAEAHLRWGGNAAARTVSVSELYYGRNVRPDGRLLEGGLHQGLAIELDAAIESAACGRLPRWSPEDEPPIAAVVERLVWPRLLVGFPSGGVPTVAGVPQPTVEAWSYFLQQHSIPTAMTSPGGHLVSFPDEGGKMQIPDGAGIATVPAWRFGFSETAGGAVAHVVEIPRAARLMPQVQLGAYFEPGAPLAEVPGIRPGASPAAYLARFGRPIAFWFLRAVIESADEIVTLGTGDDGETPGTLVLRRWEFVQNGHLPFLDVTSNEPTRPVIVDFRHLLSRLPANDEGEVLWRPVIQVARGPGEETLCHQQRGVLWDVYRYPDKYRDRFLGIEAVAPPRRGRRRNRPRQAGEGLLNGEAAGT